MVAIGVRGPFRLSHRDRELDAGGERHRLAEFAPAVRVVAHRDLPRPVGVSVDGHRAVLAANHVVANVRRVAGGQALDAEAGQRGRWRGRGSGATREEDNNRDRGHEERQRGAVGQRAREHERSVTRTRSGMGHTQVRTIACRMASSRNAGHSLSSLRSTLKHRLGFGRVELVGPKFFEALRRDLSLRHVRRDRGS